MSKASILFAKSPMAGKVKTRLIPALGAKKAAEIYRSLLLRNAALLERADDTENHIFAGGDSDLAFFKDFKDWKLHVQVSGGLGHRMKSAINSLLGIHSYVVLIGADIADAQATDIEEAFMHLERGDDLVIGPSFDGGYWLIGTKRGDLSIFENIPWSSPKVLDSTLQAASNQGLRYSLIATRHDIDTPEDLHFL